MKKTSSELKRLAREHLSNNWGLIIGANALLFGIAFVCVIPFVTSIALYPTLAQYYISTIARFVISLICILFSVGISSMHMNLARGTYCGMNDFAFAFRNRPMRFIGAYILLAILTNLPMLPCNLLTTYLRSHPSLGLKSVAVLLGIAGFVVEMIIVYRYFIVYYLLIDNPDLKVIDAFHQCASLMKGNKGRAFYLSLSFIGMVLLGILSFGIGMLWVAPYIQQTKVELYCTILDEQPVVQTADNFEDYVI